MFNLFKRKVEVDAEKNSIILSEEEKNEILNEISEKKELLSTFNDKKEKAQAYEFIGLSYEKIDNTEEAIFYLEESLNNELSIGDGYKKLMSLYNKKRAEAAKKGDCDLINYYMSKMDELRNVAKIVTLGGNKKG